MSERSKLQVRERPHMDPSRKNESIIEVWRDGSVVAVIYGSLEGLHIVSDRFNATQLLPLFTDKSLHPAMAMKGWVIPLLREGEVCPWCHGEAPRCRLCGDKERTYLGWLGDAGPENLR